MSVSVYNFGYTPDSDYNEHLDTVTLRHAHTMIHRGVADPIDLEIVDDTLVFTKVVLVKPVYRAWTESRGGRIVGFSTRKIFERDNWRCAYCGHKVSKEPKIPQRMATVDHVQPKSRGGGTTWLNLVSSCAECNWTKADRTPEEASMTLLFEPYDPNISFMDRGHVSSL